jgi:hypothetical protein
MPAPLLGKRTVTFDTEIKWTPIEVKRQVKRFRLVRNEGDHSDENNDGCVPSRHVDRDVLSSAYGR